MGIRIRSAGQPSLCLGLEGGVETSSYNTRLEFTTDCDAPAARWQIFGPLSSLPNVVYLKRPGPPVCVGLTQEAYDNLASNTAGSVPSLQFCRYEAPLQLRFPEHTSDGSFYIQLYGKPDFCVHPNGGAAVNGQHAGKC